MNKKTSFISTRAQLILCSTSNIQLFESCARDNIFNITFSDDQTFMILPFKCASVQVLDHWTCAQYMRILIAEDEFFSYSLYWFSTRSKKFFVALFNARWIEPMTAIDVSKLVVSKYSRLKMKSIGSVKQPLTFSMWSSLTSKAHNIPDKLSPIKDQFHIICIFFLSYWLIAHILYRSMQEDGFFLSIDKMSINRVIRYKPTLIYCIFQYHFKCRKRKNVKIQQCRPNSKWDVIFGSRNTF